MASPRPRCLLMHTLTPPAWKRGTFLSKPGTLKAGRKPKEPGQTRAALTHQWDHHQHPPRACFTITRSFPFLPEECAPTFLASTVYWVQTQIRPGWSLQLLTLVQVQGS